MKFFVDQDVYAVTILRLRQLGHDVATASERGMATASDAALLGVAHAEQRVFVTRDRDFGGLVFTQQLSGGVLYLRALPSTIQAVHAELERVLTLYSEADLQQSFLVIEPGRHRIRRISGPPNQPKL